jgi:6-phosphofructokinase 1
MYAIARTIENHRVEAMLVIGGWNAYEGVHAMYNERTNFPAFNIPIVCLPASINNNLPGSEFSIGADTALNNIVEAIDKIKQSAVATRRCFVVEVMGHWCGYLPEEGITLQQLQEDVDMLKRGFNLGKRLGLVIRNEDANAIYSTSFICSLFEEEGQDVFDVRPAILGHLQQGGDPSPFDRIQATRLARLCLEQLIQQCGQNDTSACFIGLQNGKFIFHDMRDFDRMADLKYQRPREQWWLQLRKIANIMAKLTPEA